MSNEKRIYYDECIVDILRKPLPPEPKPPRYISKYRQTIQPPADKKEYGAMGLAKTNTKTPKEFLKKGEGVKRPIQKGHRECFTEPLPKPPQRANTASVHKEQPANFVKRNIISAQALQPRSSQQYLVDSVNGHKFTFKNSKYLVKKNYGNVPQYLINRNNNIKRAEDKYKDELENKEHLCKMLSEEEIQEMLKGLKDNWTRINQYFTKLPLFIDTFSLINKKRKIEDHLKEIEKHIKFLEENPYIYVYDD